MACAMSKPLGAVRVCEPSTGKGGRALARTLPHPSLLGAHVSSAGCGLHIGTSGLPGMYISSIRSQHNITAIMSG
eukprot:1161223-Pelagomonas_calceolata.AAC.11